MSCRAKLVMKNEGNQENDIPMYLKHVSSAI